ncbi:ent-copalyl diphosphate synthase, chloroplastic-like [Abrus precatorius]|uniref:Ent-copalyl diphosphate synthase, chloroplastic-like n=1 Tax=Abrus precatorius TaxID=3816 RepID=A0A8B8L6N1_ABRPR|nr:ent-copalyl diphosphate synthase, chloroplastic-like [Abrus precatorius]
MWAPQSDDNIQRRDRTGAATFADWSGGDWKFGRMVATSMPDPEFRKQREFRCVSDGRYRLSGGGIDLLVSVEFIQVITSTSDMKSGLKDICRAISLCCDICSVRYVVQLDLHQVLHRVGRSAGICASSRCWGACSGTLSGNYVDELPSSIWLETVKDDDINEEAAHQVLVTNEIRRKINAIKLMLDSMEEGEITISAYDTAWVALVKNVNDENSPQFPSCLEWIANNQLPDGSWGDVELFEAHDRLINTLACVVALRSWNMHHDKCEKGIKFFKENLHKLQDENVEHMPIGFEVAFPSLLDLAASLNIEVPDDSPILKHIFAMRDIKLKKIPKEVMHKVPTTLLHSLEGMPNLDWKQLLQLQSQDGSFLFSPSSTAYALMMTKDENALKYLEKTVKRFNGGVPNVFPVDLFEHIWVVDRLDRLGISRYFQSEIMDCVSYISRFWTEKGICWARNSNVQDIDDTAMGFRLLRLNGHQVSPNVFEHFKKNGEFFCFSGQSNQAVTGMFNLFRASQVLFQGEKILEDAKNFSANFLTEKRAANELLDKWIITKDLPGEVSYALDVPWYASLSRLETRFFLEQYGGNNDVWIGKTLYRMPHVNSDLYLELAKLDYSNCQAVHCAEWEKIQRWYSESGLEGFGLSKRSVLFAYFVAAASIFESERSRERLAWAKTLALLETLRSFIKDKETRTAFVERFNSSINGPNHSNKQLNKREDELLEILLANLDYLGFEMFKAHGQEVSHFLNQTWQGWLSSWQNEGKSTQREAELIVETINLMAGFWSEELQLNPQYHRLLEVANRVCHGLRNYQNDKAHDSGKSKLSTTTITTPEIESDMQELVQLLVQNSSDGVHSNIKNSFLTVTKSFYYAAYCDPENIDSHIEKVLFQKVM